VDPFLGTKLDLGEFRSLKTIFTSPLPLNKGQKKM